MSEPIKPSGPELTRGVEFDAIPDGGVLIGQAAGEPVLLVRRGDEVFATAAACGHYGEGVDLGQVGPAHCSIYPNKISISCRIIEQGGKPYLSFTDNGRTSPRRKRTS